MGGLRGRAAKRENVSLKLPPPAVRFRGPGFRLEYVKAGWKMR